MEKYATFNRTELLLGREALDRLFNSHVAVVGCGAVGSVAAEALVRSGVGHIRLIDADVYEASNINRQLGATHGTLGEAKVEVCGRHFRDINPEIDIEVEQRYIDEKSLDVVGGGFASDGERPDVVIDAIDTLHAKVAVIEAMVKRGIIVLSSMGAARKTMPELVRTGDISRTEVCPLAREVRKRLRKAGIEEGVTCVYSIERPEVQTHMRLEDTGRVVARPALGSLMTVTGTFGLRLASECLQRLMGGVR